METLKSKKERMKIILTLRANKDFKYSDEKAEELYNYIRFLHCL